MGIQSVKNLVTLVTGGASGLGFATAQRLVKHGAKVVLCDLPKSKGPNIASKLGDENCIFVPADVSSEADVKNALDIALSKFKKLDVVVNCAGIGLISETYDFNNRKPHSLDDFSNMLKVNVIGTFNVTRLAAGVLAKNTPNADNQKGVIINTSGIDGYEGSHGRVALATCCRSVASMTLTLARDLAEAGIRCCAIAPGLFDTPHFRSLPEKYRRFIPSIVTFPKGLGHPDEFAHLVQGLIELPYCNGEVVRLDGALRQDF